MQARADYKQNQYEPFQRIINQVLEFFELFTRKAPTDCKQNQYEPFQPIINQALELFEDKEETERWLSTPKVALGGETPLEALKTDAGAKKVEELLYRAEYGIFG